MAALSSYAKSLGDLLTKPFSFDNKVEVTTKAQNGLSFVLDSTVSADGKTKANVNVKGKQGNLSVDKLTFGTEKKAVGEFKLAGVAQDLELSAKDSYSVATGELSLTLGATYKSADLGTLAVEASALKGPAIEFSFLKSISGFFVGASAKVNPALYDVSGAPAKADAKKADTADAPFSLGGVIAGYKAADVTVFAQTKGGAGFDAVDLGLTHDASSTLTVGASVGIPIAKSSDPIKFLFGGSYKVDGDSTVFATADQDAKISFAYKQKLNTFATVQVNTQVDAAQIATDNHKFGLTLSLSN